MLHVKIFFYFCEWLKLKTRKSLVLYDIALIINTEEFLGVQYIVHYINLECTLM